MTSRYPGAIDNDVTIPSVFDNLTEIGDESINGLKDAVLALERTIGVNPQGTASTLAARINGVINTNGTLKSSALTGLGLVTLPITNVQIGPTAAIEESKLDLDYPTADLKDDINTVSASVSTLSAAIGSLGNSYNGHILGVADKHDGYDVVVTAVKGQSTVEGLLNVVNNELEAHRASDTAHYAGDIPVVDAFVGISADNTQDALYALDVAGSAAVAGLEKDLGSSGIIYNGAAEVGSYGNLRDTTFTATIYETNTADVSNILRVMRPNVARVTGGVIDFAGLVAGSSDTIQVQAGGLGLGVLTVTFDTPVSKVSDLIEDFNRAAYDSHYPVAAYNVGGRLVLAHSMPGASYTIELQTVANSAYAALGFEYLDAEVAWAQNKCGAYFDGQKVLDFNTYFNGPITLAVSGNELDLGVSLSGLGMDTTNAGNTLVNITGHQNSAMNGTYAITALSGTKITINTTIDSGTFNVEVVKDAINFVNGSDGEIQDVFMEYDADGYAKVVSELRAAYVTAAGVNLASVSQDFPTTGVEWNIDGAGYIWLSESGSDGAAQYVPTGFTGPLILTSYDGVGKAVVEVTGNLPTSSNSYAITMSAFGGSSSRIYLCSVHHGGNPGLGVLRHLTDRRELGLTIANYSYDPFESKTQAEQTTDDLRSNGIVYGFEYVSNTTSAITISGGKAYVNGKMVEAKTNTISVTSFTAPSSMVLLDQSGNLVIKTTSTGGFSFDELAADGYGDRFGYATVLEYGTTGTAFDGYFYDRRLLIGDLDNRLRTELDGLSNHIAELESRINTGLWALTIDSQDGYYSSLDRGANYNFTEADEVGFAGGDLTVTTRRYQFGAALTTTPQFKSAGTTHVSVFFKATYRDSNPSMPFGTSGSVGVYGGIGIDVAGTTYEDYALVKQIETATLPTASVIERYVVSVPIADLYAGSNYFMDITPRIKVTNSTDLDGGDGGGWQPVIDFADIRIVLSNYNIAGDLADDTTNTALSAYVGNIL